MKLFVNTYRELRAGWALALVMLLMLAIQLLMGIAVGIIAGLRAGADTILKDAEAYTQAVMEAAGSPAVEYLTYVLMIAGLLLLFRLLYKRPVRQMGLYRTGLALHMLYGAVFGIAAFSLAVALLLLGGAAQLTALKRSDAWWPAFGAGFVKFILVGIFEELLSRGYMMTVLKTTRRKWLIVILPAALFGLLHIFNSHVTFFSLANITLVGLLFAYLFIRTGRIGAPIGFHITWNFVQGYVFGVPVSGSAVPEAALAETVLTGPDWLTGGAFGLEGGAACTLVIILSLVFTHFCVKGPEKAGDFWSLDSDLPFASTK